MQTKNQSSKRSGVLFYAGVIAIAMTATGLSGCASVSASNVYGNNFHYKNLSHVKVGMTKADVISTLGEPEAVGISPDGSPFFKYKLLNIHKGGTAVGLFVTYADEGESRSGYICRINFSESTSLVTSYTYKIYGSSEKFLTSLINEKGKK